MKRGYALIYVLVFISIVSITISGIVAMSLSDIRQTRKVLATDGSFQMAQSAIEDGIAQIQLDGGESRSTGYYNIKNGTYSIDNKRKVTPTPEDRGDYWFQVSEGKKVDAVGYFKGSKVRLNASCSGSIPGTNCNIYQVGF